VCLTLLPENHKEHVLILIPFLQKTDQKNKEVPNDFNHSVADTEGWTLRGDEDDGLLGKWMGLAS